ncbi:hypothetical protein M900_0851 [Bacteriovorax sp. Seq25_V]|nr:hypothetical protein M900_0851 [Bacteriovorax sp. Seq25_V]
MTLYSCATSTTVEKNTSSAQDNQELMSNCNNGDGLACSKLGFYYKKIGNIPKALEFNKKGCDLKEQSACFNLENIHATNNNYETIVASKVKFYGQDSCRCYKMKPKWYNTSRFGHKKQFIPFKVSFLISDEGEPKNITVRLSEKRDEAFEKCVETIFKDARFPVPNEMDKREHEFEFQITI